MAGRNRQASAFADGVVSAQRGSDGLAGYIVAWPAADGRYPLGDDPQQELADAVGLAREVVARVLPDFGVDRLVATSADSIHILGPAGLDGQSRNPAAVVTGGRRLSSTARWTRTAWPAEAEAVIGELC